VIVRALLAACTLLLAGTALGDARCSRTTYRGFVRDFESTRNSMRSKPAAAYAEFVALSRRSATCVQSETNKEVRFKLRLFQIGLRAYAGAANAEMGHVSLGNLQAQRALADAQQLVSANQSKPPYLRLAQELVAQLRTPLQIIDALQGSSSPGPKATP
jgi:hypothetical protein